MTRVIFSLWESAAEIASWGGLACLAASASYGLSYVYMGRYLTGRGISPVVLSASQLDAATVLLALAMPFAGLDAPEWRWDAVGSLLVLGALGTGIAYVLNYRIIQDEGPTAASVVTYLLPIVAPMIKALAWWFTPGRGLFRVRGWWWSLGGCSGAVGAGRRCLD
ncbi:EamA family transporter [Melissospora conviva]|uniref:EamA family transporter n=1 Tax=Melissospora conviva TaxID=3388432 RepID=UPI003C21C40D